MFGAALAADLFRTAREPRGWTRQTGAIAAGALAATSVFWWYLLSF